MINKELQDLAWSVLPKEFKEEVKKYYDNPTALGAKAVLLLENLFGLHNLTSDAEGEEMLTVKASVVKDIYDSMNKAHPKENAWVVKQTLEALFGSKCLPDEEQPKQKDCDNPLADKEGCRWRNDGKCAFDSACYFEPLNPQEPTPAEPKFKLGDKVYNRHNCCDRIYKVVESKSTSYGCVYRLAVVSGNNVTGNGWVNEKWLEPAIPTIYGTELNTLNHFLLSVEEACKAMKKELAKLNRK